MTLHTEDLEALADGTALSDANTIFDSMFGGATAVADDGDIITPHGGSRCAVVTCSGSSRAGVVFFAAANATGGLRVYVYLPALPTGNHLFFFGAGTGDLAGAEARIRTGGDVQLRTSSLARATSTLTVNTGQWISFDISLDGTTFTCDIYNTDADGTTPDETLTTTTAVPATIDRIGALVPVSNPSGTFGFDDILVAEAEALPARSTPSTPMTVKVRNATNDGWDDAVVKVRNATNDGWDTVLA